MSSYLITRLPSQSKAFKAIEFMQNNHYSFRVSSNSVLLEALMTLDGGDSRLAMEILDDGFQLEDDDQQLIQRLAGDSMVPQVKQEVQEEHLHLDMKISQVPNILDTERDLKPEAGLQNADSYRQAVSLTSLRAEAILGGGTKNYTQIGDVLRADSKDAVVVESSFGGNAPDPVDFDGEHDNSDHMHDLDVEEPVDDKGKELLKNLVSKTPASSFISLCGETILGGGSADSARIVLGVPVDSKDSVVVESSFVGSAPTDSDSDEKHFDGPDSINLNAADLMDEEEDDEEVEENKGIKMVKKEKLVNRARGVQKKKVGRPATVVGRLLFACPVKNCHSSYKKFEDLKDHIKIHSDKDKKNVSCNVCKKDFPSIGLVMHHIRKRTEKECCSCGWKAQNMSALLHHNRYHTKEKPYSCGLCKKNFSTNSKLQRHQNVHSGKKPFACNHCGYRTNRSDSLKGHMERMHTEVKPVVCKQELKKDLYSENKRFACSFCDYRTNRSGNLKVHIRIHTGEKPFSCEKCDKKFTQISSLNYHKRTKHDE